MKKIVSRVFIGWPILSVIVLGLFCQSVGADYSDVETLQRGGGEPTPLAAPVLVGPQCGSVFANYPRTTHLFWRPVSGAVSYTVEIDCYGCCLGGKWCADAGRTWQVVPNLRAPAYTFDFVGAQPGRWRVWAVGAGKNDGQKSEWCEFTYTR